jgi:hypothetical protein
MKAYDVKRKRIVNVEKISPSGAIEAYSMQGRPGEWFFPLIKDGKNVEEYVLLDDTNSSSEKAERKLTGDWHYDFAIDQVNEWPEWKREVYKGKIDRQR